MNISLLHPSKGRPFQALKTTLAWIEKASGKYPIEYIISLDDNDTFTDQYLSMFEDTNVRVIITPSRSCVGAVNEAAKAATGDILIVVSDDFECPLDWDRIVVRNMDMSTPCALHVDDGITNFSRIMTIPIINRQLYEVLGYVYHPAFVSMWADNHLYEVVSIKGKIVIVEDVFQHNHYINGKRKKDATDNNHGSTEKYNEGKVIFDNLIINLN
jgi:hypothetical protein